MEQTIEEQQASTILRLCKLFADTYAEERARQPPIEVIEADTSPFPLPWGGEVEIRSFESRIEIGPEQTGDPLFDSPVKTTAAACARMVSPMTAESPSRGVPVFVERMAPHMEGRVIDGKILLIVRSRGAIAFRPAASAL